MDRGNTARQINSLEGSMMNVDEIIEIFSIEVNRGLSDSDVKKRREHFGKNEFAEEEDEPLYMKIMDKLKDPLISLLLASAGISFLMGQYDDGISITLAITIVLTVAYVQEAKSEATLAALSKLVPPYCNVIRNGIVVKTEASELVPGDTCLLDIGDRVPADMRLFESINLQVDESSLTGEVKAIKKSSETIKNNNIGEIPIGERKNYCFMGTLVRSGHAKGIVTGTGEKSEFGTVYHMMKNVEAKRTPLQVKMDALGKHLSMISLVVIGVIVTIGLIQQKPILEMFTIGVSLAVAAIPEGLPIVVTTTLALGVMRMAKRNAIVKKLPAVEALGCTSVICVDKTGTLTQNAMTCVKVFSLCGWEHADVSGVGYSSPGKVSLRKENVTKDDNQTLSKVIFCGAVCNNAIVSTDGSIIGQPTEAAMLVLARKMGFGDIQKTTNRLEEIPFSSETKWMGVKVLHDNKGVCFVKGSIDSVLLKCKYKISQQNKESNEPLFQSDIDAILNEAAAAASQGLRVLAMAQGETYEQLTFLGFISISDAPREGVDVAVRTLHASHVKVVMITGDSEHTAIAVAEKLGFYNKGVDTSLSGAHITNMSPDSLANIIKDVTVFYRTSPKDKLVIVEAFQRNGHVVAMTGDGVNDAPALKAADIGISMGITGTDVSKEAADMILVDDKLDTILHAIEEGKCIFYNIKNFVRFQLSTSIAALVLVACSTIMGYHNPLNAMQILWINILMDGPPAQSLGVENVDADVMLKKPRSKKEQILTFSLMKRVLTAALIIVIGTLYIFITESDDGQVTRRDTTMTFTTFVMFDMFNALSCRSEYKSVFSIGVFSNKFFLYAVGGSLLGQFLVIYFPPFQSIFQTEALHFRDLIRIILLTSSVFWIDEFRKWFGKRTKRAGYYSIAVGSDEKNILNSVSIDSNDRIEDQLLLKRNN